MAPKRTIRFDWAIKSILRDKANFDILEGFLGALLQEEIKILNLLESESNQDEVSQKFNRVDILVQDSLGRHMIIEVQNEHEADYLERLLFGTSKAIVENIKLGEPFRKIKKVISISILYFNLGIGDDYLYHGTTEFYGIHTHNPLTIREKIETVHQGKVASTLQKRHNIFPEYYLIRVEYFQDLIQSDFDEWVYWLKNESILPGFRSKNIQKVEEKLDLMKMSPEERKRYEKYLIYLASERDIINTAKEEGKREGREEGKREGREEGKREGREEGKREGREEGKREGREEGAVSILLKMLEVKFGNIPVPILKRINQLKAEEIALLIPAVFQYHQIEELFENFSQN